MKSSKVWWCIVVGVVLVFCQCTPESADEGSSEDGAQRPSPDEEAKEATPEVAKQEQAPKPWKGCEPFVPETPWKSLDEARQGPAPAEVMVCSDQEALSVLLEGRDRRSAAVVPDVGDFKDVVPDASGMEIYDHAVRRQALVAWFTPLLFDRRPWLSQEQIEYFKTSSRAAREFESIWTAKAGGPAKLYSPIGGRRWQKLRPLLNRYRRKKAHLRHLLLRNGVLYIEDFRAAADIYRWVGLPTLFDEDEIYLRRGDGIYRLKRKDRWTYLYADGARKGERARLLLFDQVATSRERLEQRLGWDLNRLRPRAALKAFRITHHEPDLLRGRAVLRSGGELDGAAFYRNSEPVVALVVGAQKRQEVLARINLDRRGASLKRGVLLAGELMVGEELRFDEPKTEEGQQDGILRLLWRQAYKRGAHSYQFNGDRYTVYTRYGDPNVPQVCIDFVYDTVERWSGTWWAPKGQGRERLKGTIDFEELLGRAGRRQVSRLVKTAEARPDIFDVLAFAAEERIPYKDRDQFYERIEAMAPTTLPGDIFTIYGKKEDNRNHWHSFMVYDLDPVYHTPYLLIGNAGRARIQVWHDVMRSGPRRSITHRVHLREDWLEDKRPDNG